MTTTKDRKKAAPKTARITPRAIANHYDVCYDYVRKMGKHVGGLKKIENLFKIISALEKRKEFKEIKGLYNL